MGCDLTENTKGSASSRMGQPVCIAVGVAMMAVSGCGSGANRATLNIDTQVDAALALKNVSVEISAPGRSGKREFAPAAALHWTVFMEGLKANTAVTVIAKGFSSIEAGAAPVVTYAVRATLGPTETLRVVLKLTAACSPGPVCQSDENCENGACVKQPGIGVPGGTGGAAAGDASVADVAGSGGGAGAGGSGGGNAMDASAANSGGSPSSGGQSGAGGVPTASGGIGGPGGMPSSGGGPGTGGGTGGGTSGSGGSGPASGGRPGSGGAPASGGRVGTGGAPATGGAPGTGGAPVNPCLTNNGGCSVNATCANGASGRTCTCNPGYTGNGITCSKKADGQTCAAASECTSGQCVLATCCSGANCPECKVDGECTVATRPLCINTKCAACNSNAACKAKNNALPVCATTGAQIGACVACQVSSDCTVANKSICASNTCKSCLDVGGAGVNAACQLRDPNREQCHGAASDPTYGQCVECRRQEECDEDKAFCNHVTGNCESCNLATGIYNPDSACATASTGPPAKDFCHLNTGKCVVCLPGNHCPVGVPVGGGFRDGEGICQSDNSTCQPLTCTDDSPCRTPNYSCQVGYCLEPP